MQLEDVKDIIISEISEEYFNVGLKYDKDKVHYSRNVLLYDGSKKHYLNVEEGYGNYETVYITIKKNKILD